MNGSQQHPENTTQQPAPTGHEPQAAPQAPPQVPPQWTQQAQPVVVPQRDSRAKSPALACFLSAVPGLGQIYVGYYARGFVHAAVVATLFTVLVSMRDESLIPLFLIFMIFFWLYNVIDAGRRAALYNEALAGNESVALPQDLQLPTVRGSITGGVLFIVGGSVLLAHTLFGMTLEWLADWWPAIGILFGVYLVVRGMRDQAERSGQVAQHDHEDQRHD